MANPGSLGAITYEAESSAANWAEEVTTFATHRLPIIGAVDVSGLVHEKVESNRVEQYRNAGSQWILMTQSGQFSMTVDLVGHGVTTVGSPSLDALETFWGIVLGNAALSAAASTTLTGGTAAAPTTTASATFAAGSIAWIGALGDGDGNGQAYAVGTHATTTLNLIGALDDIPANGAVLAPAVNIYPSSSPTSAIAITGTRFLLQTANLQYRCHGCWPMSVSFSGLNTGERPQATITWGVSRWAYSTATFPSTVTSNQYNPSPVAAGSFDIQDVGTTTRNKRSIRNFTLDYTLGVEPLMGPGGVSAYQKIVGARRIDDKCTISWTEDADAATTTPVLPGYGTGTTSKHGLYTLSTTAGSRVAFFWPKLCVTNVATQAVDSNINRLTITAAAYTGGTLTSDLTRAMMVMANG